MKKLIIVAACVPLLASCESIESLVQGSMAPSEQAELLQYQGQIAALEKEIQALEASAEAISLEAWSKIREGEYRLVGGQVDSLLEIQEAHGAKVRQYADLVNKERQMLDEAFAARTSGVMAIAAPFIPAPLQPLIPFASTLLVFAVSTRARKHAGKAIAALAKGNLAEMGAALLKAAGAAHTSPQTKAVAEAEEHGQKVVVSTDSEA